MTAEEALDLEGHVVGPHCSDDPVVGHAYITNKEGYLRRLRRIEGQARGLQRMVEEEKYCIDILTQVSAVTRALKAVALELLEDHLNHCVVAAAKTGVRPPRTSCRRPPRPSLDSFVPEPEPTKEKQ